MEKDEKENWHIVGTIPEQIANKIGMDGKTPIWISDKITEHIEKRHGEDFKKRGTSAIAFIHKVISGFSSAYRQSDGTIVLAIESGKTSYVTYVVMELSKLNFWRVKSAHYRNASQLHKYTIIWTKPDTKKPVKR